LLLLVAALTGFSSFFYEVIWIRMLSLVLGASTHAFELMLASFLLGLALGGYWIRRRIDRSVAPALILAKVQLVMGALAILTLPVYNRTFGLMAWLYSVLAKTDGGYVLYNLGSAAISLLVMLPATCAAGMTLPLITILLMRKGTSERAIGQVYAVNTLGAIAGVACVVHVALPALGLKFSLLFAGAVDIGLGLLLLHQGGWFRLVASWQMAWPAGALGVLLLSSFAFGLDVRQTASGVYRYGSARLPEDREILFHKDGKTATVDVLRTPRGRVAILTNGKSEASVQPRIDETPPTLDTSTMVMTGLAGPLHAPDAHEAAVIGFGSGISTTTLLAFPGIRRVDTVEIEPAMVEGARHFEPLVTPAYRDPRSHIIIDDAKSTFARSGHRYDVIVSEPSNPWVSGVSSLFTTEFYQRVKQHLRAGAVLVQWIQLYEITPALVATILKTLSGQFDDYVIYESAANDIVIVASPMGKLAGLQPELLRAPEVQRLAAWARLGTPPDWSASRVGGRNLIQPYIDGWGEVTNSDYFPLVDLQAPRARFTQATAKEITELRFSPLPLGAFLGEPEPAGQPPTDARPLPLGQNQMKAAVAGEVFRHLTETTPSRDSDALLGSALYWQFRWWHDTAATCQSPISPGQMLDATLQIFGEILPHLRSSEIGHLVAVARTHACIQPHGETFRPWLAMIEAIGTRNFAAVAAAARDISSWPGQRRSALQDECLSLAAMGALVALGQSAQAVPSRAGGESPFARWQSTAWFRVLDRILGRPLTSAQ
jgi:spermidine synthase